MSIFVVFLDRPYEEPAYCGVFSTHEKATTYISNDDYPNKEDFRVEVERLDYAFTVLGRSDDGGKRLGYKQF